MKRYMSVLIIAVFLLAGCGDSGGKVRYNSPESDEVTIGVAYPAAARDADTYFYKGVKLALNTINESGGVLGKRLGILVRDDGANANTAMQIAQTFKEKGITAVVGHWSTTVCYYAQDIYEKNKVVMLTPRATGMILFEAQFDYTFRMIGNNRIFAQAIADHQAEKGFKRVAIYFSEDEYGVDFAKILERKLNALGITVVDRVTSITSLNIEQLLYRWNAFGCESVVMAASAPLYVEPIKTLRNAGCRLPIFGGDTFDWVTVGEWLDGYIDDIYIPILKREFFDEDFLKKFRSEYGHDPDGPAVTGYEAVTLLKDAMEAAQSIDGTAIASFLSSLKEHKTISGSRTYNPETQEFDGYNVYMRSLESTLINLRPRAPKTAEEPKREES